jgi:pimeloyl-ACP methyl ester carboxylesterase
MSNHSLRRALLFALGLAAGLAAGPTLFRAMYYTVLFVAGRRQPLRGHPSDLGMPAEDVAFPSSDGTPLRGWFIRRAGDDGSPAPAIVFVHGWPWNRAGNTAGGTLLPDRTVDFLAPAQALHHAGFHLLLFDLRNHGESGAALPVTFGPHEARDVAGAAAFLRARPEVDPARIGLIGYSMGANAVLFGIPHCQPIRAAIAVQPVVLNTFVPNFTRQELRPVAPLMNALAGPMLRLFGGPPAAAIDPRTVAPRLGATELLYVQGAGDPWGSLEEVRQMAAATPRARPLVVAPSDDRYGGYLYVNEHQDEIAAFFTKALQ